MTLSIDPIKPYLHAIEGVAILALIGGLWFGLHHYGNTRYEEGRADDHKGWDADRAQWQQALDKQKAEAATLLVTTIAQNDALRRANQVLHDQQEKDYANHRAETDALHAQLSHVGLRFAVPAAPARCGQGGAGPLPGTASKAQPAASAVDQLPDVLASNLRLLSFYAQVFGVDAYARCVAAVNGGPAL